MGFPGYSAQWQRLSPFRRVVVITFASRVKGLRFETMRKQVSFFPPVIWQKEKTRKTRGEAADAALGVGDHLKIYSAQESSPPFSTQSLCRVQAQFIPGGKDKADTFTSGNPSGSLSGSWIFHMFTDCH